MFPLFDRASNVRNGPGGSPGGFGHLLDCLVGDWATGQQLTGIFDQQRSGRHGSQGNSARDKGSASIVQYD